MHGHQRSAGIGCRDRQQRQQEAKLFVLRRAKRSHATCCGHRHRAPAGLGHGGARQRQRRERAQSGRQPRCCVPVPGVCAVGSGARREQVEGHEPPRHEHPSAVHGAVQRGGSRQRNGTHRQRCAQQRQSAAAPSEQLPRRQRQPQRCGRRPRHARRGSKRQRGGGARAGRRCASGVQRLPGPKRERSCAERRLDAAGECARASVEGAPGAQLAAQRRSACTRAEEAVAERVRRNVAARAQRRLRQARRQRQRRRRVQARRAQAAIQRREKQRVRPAAQRGKPLPRQIAVPRPAAARPSVSALQLQHAALHAHPKATRCATSRLCQYSSALKKLCT